MSGRGRGGRNNNNRGGRNYNNNRGGGGGGGNNNNNYYNNGNGYNNRRSSQETDEQQQQQQQHQQKQQVEASSAAAVSSSASASASSRGSGDYHQTQHAPVEVAVAAAAAEKVQEKSSSSSSARDSSDNANNNNRGNNNNNRGGRNNNNNNRGRNGRRNSNNNNNNEGGYNNQQQQPIVAVTAATATAATEERTINVVEKQADGSEKLEAVVITKKTPSDYDNVKVEETSKPVEPAVVPAAAEPEPKPVTVPPKPSREPRRRQPEEKKEPEPVPAPAPAPEPVPEKKPEPVLEPKPSREPKRRQPEEKKTEPEPVPVASVPVPEKKPEPEPVVLPKPSREPVRHHEEEKKVTATTTTTKTETVTIVSDQRQHQHGDEKPAAVEIKVDPAITITTTENSRANVDNNRANNSLIVEFEHPAIVNSIVASLLSSAPGSSEKLEKTEEERIVFPAAIGGKTTTTVSTVTTVTTSGDGVVTSSVTKHETQAKVAEPAVKTAPAPAVIVEAPIIATTVTKVVEQTVEVTKPTPPAPVVEATVVAARLPSVSTSIHSEQDDDDKKPLTKPNADTHEAPKQIQPVVEEPIIVAEKKTVATDWQLQPAASSSEPATVAPKRNLENRFMRRVVWGLAGTAVGFGRVLKTLGLKNGDVRVLRRLMRLSGGVKHTRLAQIRENKEIIAGIRCRVYRPASSSTDATVDAGNKRLLPVLLYVHGGGWLTGSTRSYHPLTLKLARDTGAIVVSPAYRLAPEFACPAAVDDVLAVARALLSGTDVGSLADEIDPTRVVIGGDSAGGNIAGAVALDLIRNGDQRRLRGVLLISPTLQAITFQSESTRKFMKNYSSNVRPEWWVAQYGGVTPTNQILEAFQNDTHLPVETRQRWLPYVMPKSQAAAAIAEAALADQSAVAEETDQLLAGKSKAATSEGKDNKNNTISSIPDSLVDFVTNVRAWPLLAEDQHLAQMPKTFVQSCSHDVLLDENLAFVERLQQSGAVDVVHSHLERAEHCESINVDLFHSKSGRHGYLEVIEFLRSALFDDSMSKKVEFTPAM